MNQYTLLYEWGKHRKEGDFSIQLLLFSKNDIT